MVQPFQRCDISVGQRLVALNPRQRGTLIRAQRPVASTGPRRPLTGRRRPVAARLGLGGPVGSRAGRRVIRPGWRDEFVARQ
jgi:hypothetical protein